MRLLLLCLGLLITSSLSAAQNPKINETKMKEMYKRGEFSPFKMKLPEGYIIMPLGRNGVWGLAEWQVIGEESTIMDLWKQSDKDPEATLNPLTGVIRMRLCEVSQKNENELNLDDEEIISAIKFMGGTNIRFRSLKWGACPVKVVEAMLPNHPLVMGWVGLNTGGETVLIHYVFPQNRTSYDKDLQIWEEFLNGSTCIPPKELFEKINKLGESLKEN